MKMKTCISGLFILSVAVGMRLPVMAQVVGLPVMDTAGTRDPGHVEFTPGVVLGEDSDFLGARATVTLMDELRGFIDLGRFETSDKGNNLALQVGALFSMDLTEVCETALRGTVYYANTDYQDLSGADLMFMFSGETLLDDLYGYGGAGIDVSKRKVYTNHSEINPALALGLTYKFTNTFWLFLEVDYVDAPFAAIGLSTR